MFNPSLLSICMYMLQCYSTCRNVEVLCLSLTPIMKSVGEGLKLPLSPLSSLPLNPEQFHGNHSKQLCSVDRLVDGYNIV